MWHLSKLTKKQKNWAKFKGKMFTIELGRAVKKYRLFKLARPQFATQKISTFKFKKAEQYQIHRNNRRHSVYVNTAVKLPVNAKLLVNNGLHSKKRLCLYVKPFWFLDKAVPVPGVAFLKKKAKL